MTSPVSLRPLRVAVWGLGGHAVKRILPAIRRALSVELYGVCSRSVDAVTTTATAFSCRGWTNAAEMLKDPAVEAVFVATPTGLHVQHGKQVLDARKHLLCEKPIAATLVDAQALVSLSRAADRSIFEGLMYLYHPQFEVLRRFIAEGRIGSLVSVCSQFCIPALGRVSFRSDARIGGGAFLDLACYPISAILALVADNSWEVRYASIGQATGSAVDTDGCAFLTLEGGVRAHFEWRSHSAYRNDVTLWGTDGSVFLDRVFSAQPDYIPEFQVRDARGSRTIELGAAGDQFVRMIDAFVHTAREASMREVERVRIVSRAQLLERIFAVAERN